MLKQITSTSFVSLKNALNALILIACSVTQQKKWHK